MNHMPINLIPKELRGPFQFREPNGDVEGEVDTILEVLYLFEPIDVLDGVIEILDANKNVITVHTSIPKVKLDNEYPVNFEGIYIRLKG